MKYKILVLKNSSTIDVTDECEKAVTFFATRPKPIYVEFSFKDINIPVDYKVYKTVQGFSSETGEKMLVNYYGLVDSVKDEVRKIVKEKEYNCVMIVNDISNIPVVAGKMYSINWTNYQPLYFGVNNRTGYIQIVFNSYLKQTGEVSNAIKHEQMHDFCNTLNQFGYSVLDEMDISHNGIAFYKNDFPEDLDSNFGFTLKNIAPYLEHIYTSAIILGMRTLRLGDRGEDVKELQKLLKIASDGIFGINTQNAVKAFQTLNLLVSDGIVGQKTIAKLNNKPKTLIDALIQVESGGDDFAVGDKNLANKAYGCLQIRKPYVDDINSNFGKNYKAQDCLGNRKLSIELFNLYMQIYGEDKTDEQKARIHNGGPNGWQKDSTIAYWNKVKKFL